MSEIDEYVFIVTPWVSKDNPLKYPLAVVEKLTTINDCIIDCGDQKKIVITTNEITQESFELIVGFYDMEHSQSPEQAFEMFEAALATHSLSQLKDDLVAFEHLSQGKDSRLSESLLTHFVSLFLASETETQKDGFVTEETLENVGQLFELPKRTMMEFTPKCFQEIMEGDEWS